MSVHYQQRQALGSQVRINLVSAAADKTVNDLMKQLWLEVFLFEKRCSRFLPGSELSAVNRSAGVRQQISPELQDVLMAAGRMAAATEGLFNPFVLPVLQRTGYRDSLVKGYANDMSDDHSQKALVPASALEIGEGWVRLPYGSALDLGGCGKGYIGDKLAAMAQASGALQGFWLSVGGDTVVWGVDDMDQPWRVYLQPDPAKDLRIGEAVAGTNGCLAVATSTTMLRRGHSKKSGDWHHIIDPRTAAPATSDLQVAVVCANNLLEADVLASCAIIHGSIGLQPWLRGRGIMSACWVESSGGLGMFGDSILPYTNGDNGQSNRKQV